MRPNSLFVLLIYLCSVVSLVGLVDYFKTRIWSLCLLREKINLDVQVLVKLVLHEPKQFGLDLDHHLSCLNKMHLRLLLCFDSQSHKIKCPVCSGIYQMLWSRLNIGMFTFSGPHVRTTLHNQGCRLTK